MSDQQSFKSGDDDAPRAARDAAGDAGIGPDDSRPFPSGAELRAAVCRAAWDAAVELDPIESAWDSAHRNDNTTPSSFGGYLAQLPTTNGEALRQVVATRRNANGVEVVSGRNVVLARSWSNDQTRQLNAPGDASIRATQNYHFVNATDCDSMVTSVAIAFDLDHTVPALDWFLGEVQRHGQANDMSLRLVAGLMVTQHRVPTPEEMHFLAEQRLQPDLDWTRDLMRRPWPGFQSSIDNALASAGIIWSEPFRAICN